MFPSRSPTASFPFAPLLPLVFAPGNLLKQPQTAKAFCFFLFGPRQQNKFAIVRRAKRKRISDDFAFGVLVAERKRFRIAMSNRLYVCSWHQFCFSCPHAKNYFIQLVNNILSEGIWRVNPISGGWSDCFLPRLEIKDIAMVDETTAGTMEARKSYSILTGTMPWTSPQTELFSSLASPRLVRRLNWDSHSSEATKAEIPLTSLFVIPRRWSRRDPESASRLN